MLAAFGKERELQNKLSLIEYENGNGDFHFHSQIEICLVESGELDALVSNHKKRLKAGEVSVALSYDTHVYLPVRNATFSVLIIPLSLCGEFMGAIKHQRIANPFLEEESVLNDIKTCFRKIKACKGNMVRKLGYVYLILGAVLEHASFEPGVEPPITELSSRLLFFLHESFHQEISLSSLSKEFCYSESYLSKYFKSCFGIGLHQYITMLRLKNAIMLMKEGKYSITYCAMESGFTSLRTFYRVFEEEFHCSPKAYLKNLERT